MKKAVIWTQKHMYHLYLEWIQVHASGFYWYLAPVRITEVASGAHILLLQSEHLSTGFALLRFYLEASFPIWLSLLLRPGVQTLQCLCSLATMPELLNYTLDHASTTINLHTIDHFSTCLTSQTSQEWYNSWNSGLEQCVAITDISFWGMHPATPKTKFQSTDAVPLDFAHWYTPATFMSQSCRAWVPSLLYPWLMACMLKLFGPYSTARI